MSELDSARRVAPCAVAALFYTLMESAGANPKQYLREATGRAIATPAAVTLPRELLAK